jgi:Holliday junction resolvase
MVMMVALVGEQPLPNFFPVHHFHPEEVLLVYTEKTRYYYRHLQHTLQEHTKIHGLEVHPYRIPEIVTELQTKLKELAWISSPSLIFNLTGGTKPMLVASYQIAQVLSTPVIYLQSEGKQTRIYTYIWENQQLRIQNEEVVPDCITLREVFDLHYGPGKWSAESPKKDDGGNFERAVAEILQKQEYEVMTNVKAADKQVEIDIAVRSGNQYGIIEAKLGKEGKSMKAIRQLTLAWRSLGTYARKFHVITVNPTEQHNMITEMLDIKTISLRSYDKTTRMLSPSDLTLLLESVENALR